VAFSPAAESAIGAGLKTPTQVAVDINGNSYVADSSLGSVLMYPAGSGATATPASFGNSLVSSPTGVAVDGAGDIFFAGSGNVYEVPNTPSGYTASQIPIKTGLGSNLSLAVDGTGNLFIADPTNNRVVKIVSPGGTFSLMAQSENDLTSFGTPSAVTADAAGNLYVVDGANLIQVTPAGQQTTITNSLSNATGVALDPSGAIYISSTAGTSRIPYVNGAWVPDSAAPVATSVTNAQSVAVDLSGNVYLADATAENIHFASAGGALNFGTLANGDTPSLDATLTNEGNSTLTISGFSSTNALDFTADGPDCTAAAVPQGGTCDITVTMAPGPGEQGPLTAQITAAGNQANGTAMITATGVGSTLADSMTTLALGSAITYLDTPATVTVAPASGTGVPTGNVSLTIDGGTATVAALSNGTAKFNLVGVAPGSHTFTATYQGDRVYGRSSASATGTVTKATPTMNEPAPPAYVLSNLEVNGDTSTQPYLNASNYAVQLSSAAGVPTGTVTFMEGTSAACSSSGSAIDANGYASFSTSCLSIPNNTTPTTLVVTHTLTPVYNGDANFASYTGNSIIFTELRNPSVIITSNPSSLTVQAGSAVTANLTLTSLLGYGVSGTNQPIYNYTLPLALGCSGLPPHSTCSFSSSSIAVTPTTPGTATVTIQTNVPVGTSTSSLRTDGRPLFAILLGAGLLGMASRKFRRHASWLVMLSMVALGGAFMGMAACSTTNLSTGSTDSQKTPANTYAVTITAVQVGSTTVPGQNGGTTTVYGSHDQISLPFTINVTVQ